MEIRERSGTMDQSKKKPELTSDSALNPGYESTSHLKPTNLFNVEASLGTSGVTLGQEHEEDGVDERTEKEMFQHNQNE
jgi:hypothetical protein